MNNDNYNNYDNQNYQFGNYYGNSNQNNAPRRPDNQKSVLLILILMVLILLLIVMTVGVVLYSKKSSDENDQQKVVTAPVESEQPQQAPQIQPKNELPPVQQDPVIQPPADNSYNDRMAIKNNFLSRADEITLYEINYLDTAMNQSAINVESGNVFTKWDVLLNDVYKYLKTIMSKSQFKNLENDELDWIKRKEAAIERAGIEWQGGSGEPMARNMAGIEYTRERCYYLISLIS